MTLPDWAVAGADLVVGSGFALGILLMNFPQHYECWKHRSAEGLSLAYILICTISNVTLWLATLLGDYNLILAEARGTNATVIIHPTNAPSVEVGWDSNLITTSNTSSRMLLEDMPPPSDQDEDFDVSLLRLFNTLNACMPTFQNFLCVLVGVPSLIFYYFMFSQPQRRVDQLALDEHLVGGRPASQEPLLRLEPSEEGQEELMTTNSNTTTPRSTPRLYYSDGTEHWWAKIFTVLTLAICLVCTLISGVVLLNNSIEWEETLLAVFGTIAAITNMVLYIPQIVTTHRNQHEGVLSLSSLLISVGGDGAMAVFWIVGPGESIWVLASLAADAGMQLILIWMIVDFRKKRFNLQRQQQQAVYEYVHDTDEMDDSHCGGSMGKGEIEVVFGDLLEMYEDTASVVGKLMETPSTRQSTTSTSPESMGDSSSELII